MEKPIILSVVSKPEQAGTDLSALAGRWDTEVDIKISNPARFKTGPIRSKILEKPIIKPILTKVEKD